MSFQPLPEVSVWRVAVLAFCASCTSARPAPVAIVHEASLAPAYRAGAHEARVNGVRLAYTVGGAARTGVPPIVFLHGGPGQGSAHFERMTGPLMERTLRMIYLDQRGSGASERPASNDYAIATLVQDIEALRAELGVQKIAVLGHSFGGILALEYAAKHPDRVSHVIFVDGLWDAPLQCRFRKERLAALRPEAYAKVQGDTLNRDGTAMPVPVMAGAHDGAAGPPGQRELVRRLPNARYVEFEKSGHFVYLDEPERFAAEVTAFVTPAGRR